MKLHTCFQDQGVLLPLKFLPDKYPGVVHMGQKDTYNLQFMLHMPPGFPEGLHTSTALRMCPQMSQILGPCDWQAEPVQTAHPCSSVNSGRVVPFTLLLLPFQARNKSMNIQVVFT